MLWDKVSCIVLIAMCVVYLVVQCRQDERMDRIQGLLDEQKHRVDMLREVLRLTQNDVDALERANGTKKGE